MAVKLRASLNHDDCCAADAMVFTVACKCCQALRNHMNHEFLENIILIQFSNSNFYFTTYTRAHIVIYFIMGAAASTEFY